MSLLDTLLWEGKLFAQPHLTTSLAGKTYVVTGGLAGPSPPPPLPPT